MAALRDVLLSSVGVSDASELFPIWSDYEAVKFTNWTHTPTLDVCVERLQKVLHHYGREPRHFGPYGIHLEGAQLVGLIGADHSATLPGEYEVWYILRRDHWGKGIASRALADLLEQMARSNRVTKAKATAVTATAASWRLLEKHGFAREDLIPGGHQRHGLALDLYAYGKSIAR